MHQAFFKLFYPFGGKHLQNIEHSSQVTFGYQLLTIPTSELVLDNSGIDVSWIFSGDSLVVNA